MTHIVRHVETLAAFNLPDGRGFRIDCYEENGVVTRIEGIYLDGPVATDDTDDGDSVDSILIYEKEEEEEV